MTAPLRILLLGDGHWAAESLRQLARGPHRVVGVVARAQPSDGTLLEAAAELDVPVLQPRNVNAPAALEALRRLGADLGLSVAYNQILGAPVLALAPLGFLNVHAGKLPEYRGRNVINWAILNGERELGVTVHYMDEGIDTGDIVIQRSVPIGPADTYGEVLCRVVRLVPRLVERVVELAARGAVRRRPQTGAASYGAGRAEGDEWLDWSERSARLHDKVRAISRPGPGAKTVLDRTVVTIWRARWDPAGPRYFAAPGQVVARRPDGVLVKTGDGTLLIEEVEIDPAAPGPPAWPVGTRLGINPAAVIPALLARIAALETELGRLKGTHATP